MWWKNKVACFSAEGPANVPRNYDMLCWSRGSRVIPFFKTFETIDNTEKKLPSACKGCIWMHSSQFFWNANTFFSGHKLSRVEQINLTQSSTKVLHLSGFFQRFSWLEQRETTLLRTLGSKKCVSKNDPKGTEAFREFEATQISADCFSWNGLVLERL